MVNMKKISIIALTILTLGMTSCDMDKMPYDAVPTEEALTTIVGFEEARAGIYSVYLGLTGGSYVLAPEVQADAFNAVADFSNKYGELHRWTFESTNSTVETIWSNYYAAIGRVNFFIDGVGKTYVYHVVFKNASLTIERGDKVAFVGKNGEGTVSYTHLTLPTILLV